MSTLDNGSVNGSLLICKFSLMSWVVCLREPQFGLSYLRCLTSATQVRSDPWQSVALLVNPGKLWSCELDVNCNKDLWLWRVTVTWRVPCQPGVVVLVIKSASTAPYGTNVPVIDLLWKIRQCNHSGRFLRYTCRWNLDCLYFKFHKKLDTEKV